MPPSPRKTIRPHFASRADRRRRAASLAEQSTARSTPWPPVSCRTSATLSGPLTQHLVAQAQVAAPVACLSGNTSMPMIVCAPSFRQSAPVASAHRPQTRDQHRIISADPDFLQALHTLCRTRTPPARHRYKKAHPAANQIFLFGQQVIRHAAIALPAVGAPILFAGAGNHVSAPTIIAKPHPEM